MKCVFTAVAEDDDDRTKITVEYDSKESGRTRGEVQDVKRDYQKKVHALLADRGYEIVDIRVSR